LHQVAELPVDRCGNMNALQLSPAQVLRQTHPVKPIGLNPLSARSRNHRRSRYQTAIPLRYDPIIQSIPRWSSLVRKRYLLIPKMFTHMLDQMLRTIRHMQRADKSLVITKGHRDTPLVNVQSRKHIVVPWYKRLASHRSASLAQWLSPLYQSTRCQAQHPSYRSQGRGEHSRTTIKTFGGDDLGKNLTNSR